jgi:hypothetical protein
MLSSDAYACFNGFGEMKVERKSLFGVSVKTSGVVRYPTCCSFKKKVKKQTGKLQTDLPYLHSYLLLYTRPTCLIGSSLS